ncbi:hypothetical protein [Microvirga sp. G4-2]|uniref:hypothetical protein n=1 Tax=Microvirga sp. G4-2 TaxID=3434467 RepID=UPI004043C35B
MPLTLAIQSFTRPGGSNLIRLISAGDGTQSNGDSFDAQFSADGRYVVFRSDASNLVAGDTNGSYDIFRKDLVTGAVERVSVAADGTQASSASYTPSVSADGRYVVFWSSANHLVAGDANNAPDIFRKDLVTGAVERVSIAADGTTQGNGVSSNAHVSADGRYVVFESSASNLVADDTNGRTDIFRKDLVTGELVRVSMAADGTTQGDASSFSAHISADGRYVVFESSASNLVADDTNNAPDVFRKDLITGAVERLSMATDGITQGNSFSSDPHLSADGRYVIFSSDSSNLVPGDGNREVDIFLVDTAPPNRQAIVEGRYVEAALSVGAAWQVSVAWGDGTTSSVVPVNGRASFSHAYDTTGVKAASITVKQGAQSWIVPYRIDLAAGTMARNTALADILSGGAGRDALTGDPFANKIYGLSDNDKLLGGTGNDTLYGGAGSDTLEGGTGRDVLVGGTGTDRDVFVFKDRPGSTNYDKITDYNKTYDSIQLDNKYMSKLGGVGRLSSSKFVLGTKAKDANDHLIYDRGTGNLYYDADGSGAAAKQLIAQFTNKAALAYSEFTII